MKFPKLLVTIISITIVLTSFTKSLAQNNSRGADIAGTPAFFSLTSIEPSEEIIFQIPSNLQNIIVSDAFLQFTQAQTISSSTILKLYNTDTNELVGALTTTSSGIKEFKNLSSQIKNRLKKESIKFKIEAEGLGSSDTLNATEVKLILSYTDADTIPPSISDIRIKETTSDTAVIEWKSDEAADQKLIFGKTSKYGDTCSDINTQIINGGFQYSCLILNLIQGTTYHFQIVAEDPYGNISKSEDKTFITVRIEKILGEESETSELDRVIGIQGEVFKEKDKYKVRLGWELLDDSVEGYYIYRQEGGGETQKLEAVSPTRSYFIDETVEEGKSYTYSIRAFKTILLSPKSTEITLDVNESNLAEEKNLLDATLNEVLIITFAATLIILLIGYFLVRKFGKVFREIFFLGKRGNNLKEPSFIKKAFEDVMKDQS